MARMFACPWAFVVRRYLSTFLSLSPPPTHHLISARISARARPPITPTGSPDARYARAHPHELRTPTHAPSRHRYPVRTLTHTLSARTTPHVRPSCVSGCQAHAGTHARPRSTRRTELDGEGLAGRRFGPVCRGFRVYKHPHLYTHLPAIHPRAHSSFPLESPPRQSQQPTRQRVALLPVPTVTNIVSNPRPNRFPFLSQAPQHPCAPSKTTQSARRSWEKPCQFDKLALPTLGPEAKSRQFRISGCSTQRDRTFYTRLNSR
jgi:hypothetical protein